MEYFSHIGQDQWVVETLKGKRGGYFLDFGSLDGVKANNTLALERSLGWNGICVEANPTYYPKVCASRSVITINAALWNKTGDVVEMVDAWGLSSVVQYQQNDSMYEARVRDTKRTFKIETITPTDLLDRFDAPRLIDFMSLDIEGSEMDVLRAFDLNRYHIALMAIEHSHEPEKQAAIRGFLAPYGYIPIERGYDDWFYQPDYLAQLETDGPYDPVAAHRKVVDTYVSPEL